jgi:hypothetical protein
LLICTLIVVKTSPFFKDKKMGRPEPRDGFDAQTELAYFEQEALDNDFEEGGITEDYSDEYDAELEAERRVERYYEDRFSNRDSWGD